MGKENVKRSGNVKKKAVVEKDEEEGPDVREQLVALSVPEKLAVALAEVREPSEKVRIQDDVKELAWQLKTSFEGYKYEPRGPLFSDQLTHVSSLECVLAKDSKGPLEPEDCQLLWDAARAELEHVSGICVQWMANGKPKEGWGAANLKQKDITSVTITGMRKVPGGWMLPASLALTGQSKYAVKVPDIVDNIDKGDFAAALLQLQELFKQKKRVRDALVTLDNDHLGRLRFLVTQLQMLDDYGPKQKDKQLDYIKNPIGGLSLSWYEKEPTSKTANDLLQKRAALILSHLYPTLAPNIKPSSQRDIFVQAYERALGAPKQPAK